MKNIFLPVTIVLVLTILGCVLIANEYQKGSRKGDAGLVMGTVPEGPEIEQDIDLTASHAKGMVLAVVAGVDPTERLLTLKDVESDKTGEVPYDGTTAFYDKFGQSITAGELSCGDIVDVRYDDGMKLTSVKQSSDIFTITDVVKYSVDEQKKIFTVAGDSYKFNDDVYIYSDDEKGSWMDLTDMDTLTVRGMDRTIWSVVVQKGHGYIRLKNDTYFVGGWIEVGNEIIRTITEDMLMVAPEGDFHVRLTNGGYLGEKDVQIIRNKETVIDLSEIEIEEVAIGHVEFTLSPVYAQLYIDGQITEYEERVPLEYGIHNIRVEAAGYETVTTNIKVGAAYANVDIALDPDGSESTASNNTEGAFGTTRTAPNGQTTSTTTATAASTTAPYISGTASQATPSATSATSSTGTTAAVTTTTTAATSSTQTDTNVVSGTKKIFVEQPAGAEVYLDGSYIGIAPASTTKVTGMHIITLSKTGFVTKSYTVTVENDGKDITFSFSDLEKAE
ncbi:MAG: PEGA domain-containing protein [Lachnospiraceae bacterium]|nr:PEGA domain-containing protein [Lachnospiraceae bacterium]